MDPVVKLQMEFMINQINSTIAKHENEHKLNPMPFEKHLKLQRVKEMFADAIAKYNETLDIEVNNDKVQLGNVIETLTTLQGPKYNQSLSQDVINQNDRVHPFEDEATDRNDILRDDESSNNCRRRGELEFIGGQLEYIPEFDGYNIPLESFLFKIQKALQQIKTTKHSYFLRLVLEWKLEGDARSCLDFVELNCFDDFAKPLKYYFSENILNRYRTEADRNTYTQRQGINQNLAGTNSKKYDRKNNRKKYNRNSTTAYYGDNGGHDVYYDNYDYDNYYNYDCYYDYDNYDLYDDRNNYIFETNMSEKDDSVYVSSYSLEKPPRNTNKITEDTRYEKEYIEKIDTPIDKSEELAYNEEEVGLWLIEVNNEADKIFRESNSKINDDCGNTNCKYIDSSKCGETLKVSSTDEYGKDNELYDVTLLDNTNELNDITPLALSASSDYSQLESFTNEKVQENNGLDNINDGSINTVDSVNTIKQQLVKNVIRESEIISDINDKQMAPSEKSKWESNNQTASTGQEEKSEEDETLIEAKEKKKRTTDIKEKKTTHVKKKGKPTNMKNIKKTTHVKKKGKTTNMEYIKEKTIYLLEKVKITKMKKKKTIYVKKKEKTGDKKMKKEKKNPDKKKQREREYEHEEVVIRKPDREWKSRKKKEERKILLRI